MKYVALLRPVGNRGMPPSAFLDELVAWGKSAAEEIFAPNSEPDDEMSRLEPLLGPWESPLHRRAALCELLRCLAGFESSWYWQEGVDRTNNTSTHVLECQETGIFQVSFNSLNLEKNGRTLRDLLDRKGIHSVADFIAQMKVDHSLALEYAARLLRISWRWDGPIKRHEIDASLSRAAVREMMNLL